MGQWRLKKEVGAGLYRSLVRGAFSQAARTTSLESCYSHMKVTGS